MEMKNELPLDKLRFCSLEPHIDGRLIIGDRTYSSNWPLGRLPYYEAIDLVSLGIKYGLESYKNTGIIPDRIEVVRKGNLTNIIVSDYFTKESFP